MGEKNDSYGIDDLKRDLVPIIKRIPAYTKLISAFLRDPRISKRQKATLGAGLAYLASPVDFIPGVVPVLGQLDDLLATLIALNSALSHAPKEVVEPHLKDSGLSFEIVREDAATVKRIIKELSVAAARAAGRGLSKLGRALLDKAQRSIRPKS
jgi:uncharacterized membrane protein YkvA (DUF1232 family)